MLHTACMILGSILCFVGLGLLTFGHSIEQAKWAVIAAAVCVICMGILSFIQRFLKKAWSLSTTINLVPIPGTDEKYYVMQRARDDAGHFLIATQDAKNGKTIDMFNTHGHSVTFEHDSPDAEIRVENLTFANPNSLFVNDKDRAYDVRFTFRIPKGAFLTPT